MNEEKAREILQYAIQPDNSLDSLGHYVDWHGGTTVTLDGTYSLEDLKAMVWWMENKKVPI